MGRSVHDAVLRRLRSVGGLRAQTGKKGEDLRVSVMGAESITFVLEVKHRFSDDAVQQLKRMQQRLRSPVLLVIRELSPKRREDLRSNDLSWIEYGTGLVHLRAPGLAIDLPEQSSYDAVAESSGVPSLAGKAGVVVEALLELAREREFVTQPEVAKLSGSTQAWASKVFSALVDADALEVRGAGPRKEWRPRIPTLLDLWVRDRGPAPASTGLYVWGRTPEHMLGRLTQLDSKDVRYAVGGVTAGDLHEPTLSAPPLPSVWVPAATPPEYVASALGGEVVDAGANLVVWQTAGDPALRLAGRIAQWRTKVKREFAHLVVVTPARAVVECMQATGRGPEVGEKLREKILNEAAAKRTNKAEW
jgi:hypothetical protein